MKCSGRVMACGGCVIPTEGNRPEGRYIIVHFATETVLASRLGSLSAKCPMRRCPFPPATFLSFPHHQLSLPSLPTIMSAGPSTSSSTSTSTSQSNFVSIFNAALESYKRKTKRDLASHPVLPSLQSCDSPEAILTVLREQIPALSQSQNADDSLTKWVTPTVNVLYAFSATLGQGVGLVNIKISPREEFLL